MSWLSEVLDKYTRHQETTLLDEADRAHRRERMPRSVATTAAADLIDRTTDDMTESEAEWRDRPPGCGTIILAIIVALTLGYLFTGGFGGLL